MSKWTRVLSSNPGFVLSLTLGGMGLGYLAGCRRGGYAIAMQVCTTNEGMTGLGGSIMMSETGSGCLQLTAFKHAK